MVYNINQPNRVFVDSNGTQYTVFFNNIKTINGKKLIKESTDKVIYIKDTLGIERKDMPQISSKDILDYVKWLQRNKIKVYYKNVKISDLNLTQKDINLDKVKNLINDNDAEIGKIICSNDYYILDGHHRVVAQQYQNPNKIIKVLVVDLDIYRLLTVSKKYKKSFKRDITEMKLQNLIRQIIKEEVNKALTENDKQLDRWKIRENIAVSGKTKLADILLYFKSRYPGRYDLKTLKNEFKDLKKDMHR